MGIHENFTVLNPKNITISEFCGINHDVFIVGHHRIEIGSYVVLSVRCMLIDTGLDKTKFLKMTFQNIFAAPSRSRMVHG